MAKFNSFVEPLTEILKLMKNVSENPYIVEYGPGGSTKLMLSAFPNADILTIEHDKKWYDIYRKDFKDVPNVNLQFVPLSENYVTYPDASKKADFVYVDGRKRAECLLFAQKILKPNGFIALHDAERATYKAGYANWPKNRQVWCGEKGNRTLILVTSQHDLDALIHLETSTPKHMLT